MNNCVEYFLTAKYSAQVPTQIISIRLLKSVKAGAFIQRGGYNTALLRPTILQN